MGALVIPSNEYRRERWRNGLGWTRQIHVGRLDPDTPAVQHNHWDWRISIAEIDADAAFSRFPGFERDLVLLSGGVRLRFDDGEMRELVVPHARTRFAGERDVLAELVAGPSRVLNLMWRRDLVAAQVLHRPLVGPMVLFVEPHRTWAVHVLAGQARVADDSGLPALAAADTAILQAGATRLRHVIDGGGEVLLLRVDPVTDTARPVSPA